MAAVAPVAMHRAIPAEEAARADFHALIARLLHAPADDALLASLASAPEMGGDSALARTWRELGLASRAMDEDAARAEYEALFGGVGKAAVSIYAGFYTGAPAADHPRVRLQRDLAQLGLARRAGHPEPEDHFAALFDVMRVLVAGGAGRDPATLAEQRAFFETHLAPGARAFFATLAQAAPANYYRKVAQFGAAFVDFESQSFELD